MNVSALHATMHPLMATAAIDDADGVNLLIMMKDDVVKQKVGEAFTAQLQNNQPIQSTFFPNPATLLAPLPSALNDWVGQVASSLIALALAQCSSYGFSSTVNSAQAQSFLNANLTPSNNNFMSLAVYNYQTLFPTYCVANGISFSTFLTGTYGSAARWGTLPCRSSVQPGLHQPGND